MEELEKDPRIAQKIKRFRNKQAQMKHIFTEVKQCVLTHFTAAFFSALNTWVEVSMSTVKSCIALLAKSDMMLIKRATFILFKFECKHKRPKMLENN